MARSLVFIVSLLGLLASALLGVGVTEERRLDPARVSADSGFAFIAPLVVPWPWTAPSDGLDHNSASRLRLFEDGRELGPAHSPHQRVRQTGAGAFSHWGEAVWFSASDNSDPRANGRVYVVGFTMAAHPALTAALALASALGALAAGAPWARAALRRRTTRDRSAPLAARDLAVGLGVFAAVWLAVGLAYGLSPGAAPPPAPGGNSLVTSRVAHYRLRPGDYDMVFLGDSRTYCGIHPEIIDPLLGTRSINLSAFANWFPTQYPLVRDVVASIPKGTVVVWSIGHQNFAPAHRVQRVYPVGWPNALRYLGWRVPTVGLWDNLAYFTPGLALLADREELRRRWVAIMAEPASALWPGLVGSARAAAPAAPIIAPNAGIEAAQAGLLGQYAADPRVRSVELVAQDGKANSVVLKLMGGGYYRIETDPGFFRARQREMAQAADPAAMRPVPPHPAYLRLFEEMLDIFKEAGVRLVVNELEEAPFKYPSPANRAQWRQIMRDHVQPRVEARGFAYVRAITDELTDADYFDYNHLNSGGVQKYAPRLGAALRAVMAAPGP